MSFAVQPESPESLYEAASTGDLERVTELVEGRNRSGRFLKHGLDTAAYHDHTAVARYLLERGASVETVSLSAARSKSLEILELLVQYGWDVTDSCSFSGGNAILREVISCPVLVRWLLNKGVNPNCGKPNFGYHPPDGISGEALNRAAGHSTPETFELILNHGAKLENSCPLHYAAKSYRPDAERLPMMTFLLRCGLDVDGFDSIEVAHGRGTALWWAVNCRMIERARFLLNHGANPHLRKKTYQRSPLNEARRMGFTAFIEICPVTEVEARG